MQQVNPLEGYVTTTLCTCGMTGLVAWDSSRVDRVPLMVVGGEKGVDQGTPTRADNSSALLLTRHLSRLARLLCLDVSRCTQMET